MAPRRPTAAHVVTLAQPGQAMRQFIAHSPADLARQMKQAAPDLPPTLLDQLARLAIERRAKVELPDLLTVRHVSTLTAEPVQATRPAPQARQQAQQEARQPNTQQETRETATEADEPTQRQPHADLFAQE